MKLFKLVGKESIISLHLSNPIHLDEGAEYKIALTGFYSDNFIYNFPEDVPYCFGYIATTKDKKTVSEHYPINKGHYSIATINAIMVNALKSFKTKYPEIGVSENEFQLYADGAYVQIKTPLKILPTAKFVDLLGLKDGNVEANILTRGVKLPKLRAVDVIEIHCNLAEHSFVNHETHWHKHDETEILYHFFPNVPHGYKISEVPQDKFYVPVKSGLTTIREIKITIKDQDNQLIANDDVVNIVYLSLIKV